MRATSCGMSIYTLCMLFSLCMLTTGCTYLRNRVDDFSDMFVFELGGTASTDTPAPPGFGVYLEATDFMHFGGMLYSGYMAGLDRRGAAITKVNYDKRWGIGPFHQWYRDETYGPANIYKSGSMRTWEYRMASKSVGGRYPAKILRYHEGEMDHYPHDWEGFSQRDRKPKTKLGRYPRGWQDWGYVGVDVALSEPFLIHAGVRVRAGIDLSQIMDFVIGIFGLDLYSDDATTEELQQTGDPDEGDDAPEAARAHP